MDIEEHEVQIDDHEERRRDSDDDEECLVAWAAVVERRPPEAVREELQVDGLGPAAQAPGFVVQPSRILDQGLEEIAEPFGKPNAP